MTFPEFISNIVGVASALLTALHLSDLHRFETAPVSNDLLLSCLLLDLEKQPRESPPIRKCDVAVVTGDLVRGAQMDDANFAETLRKQYREAKSFLTRLSDELFDGVVEETTDRTFPETRKR